MTHKANSPEPKLRGALPAPVKVNQAPMSDLPKSVDPAWRADRCLETWKLWAIHQALLYNGGNQTHAARMLGISRRTIRYKVSQLVDLGFKF